MVGKGIKEKLMDLYPAKLTTDYQEQGSVHLGALEEISIFFFLNGSRTQGLGTKPFLFVVV